MKRTKNIFKKILMVLCTFALFVPMAFGLVACDSTPNSGNEGGYGKSAVEDDRLLYAKTIVAGIDYIENNNRNTTNITNILASMIAVSGEVSQNTDESHEKKFKLTIKVKDTPVYELFFNVKQKETEKSNETLVSAKLDKYEDSSTYTLDGYIQTSDGSQYIFTAKRVVDNNGAVTSESTINISKQDSEKDSLTATGTLAKSVTFSNGITEDSLCSVKFGTKGTELAEATVDDVTYTAVANKEGIEPTLSQLSQEKSELKGTLVLNGVDTKYNIIIKYNITGEGETQS